MTGLSMKRPSIFYSAFTEVLSFQEETFINFQFGDAEQIYSDTILWGKSAASKRWAVDAASAWSQPTEGHSLSPIPTELINPQ